MIACPPFAAGSVLALVFRGKNLAVRQGAHWIYPVLLLAVLLVAIGVYRMLARGAIPSHYAAGLSLVLAATVVGLIDASLRSGATRIVLSWGPLVFVGRISFSVSLWHMFIIRLCSPLELAPVVKAWAVGGLAVAVAAVSPYVIEKLGIHMGVGSSVVWSGQVGARAPPLRKRRRHASTSDRHRSFCPMISAAFFQALIGRKEAQNANRV